MSLAAFIVIFAVDKAADLAALAGGRLGWLLPLFLYLAVYVAIGFDVLREAAEGILHGQLLDENFLMSVATLGAFALHIFRGASGMEAEGAEEACAVLLFYQVGEFFEHYATGKSRKSISALMDIRPDSANLLEGGEVRTVSPEEVKIGDIIVVNPGERVPLDGVCVRGATSVDMKALTGESAPVSLLEGERAISGAVNLTDRVEVRVDKLYHDGTAAKILDLVQNAADKKSKTENFITKFSRIYTPTVVVCALLLAVIPGAVSGDWTTWIYRALNFLVISCPCALVISIPLSFFAGIGRASRDGILIKGSDYIEKLAKADVFVFDKTGTLTKGNFKVGEVLPADKRDEVLRLAAACEQGLSHPIARSITEAYGGGAQLGWSIKSEAGLGVTATKDGEVLLCGGERLMAAKGVAVPEELKGVEGAVYVAKDGALEGVITIEDEIKPDAAEAVKDLSKMGARTLMLTGDGDKVAKKVAEAVGIDDYRASLLSADKVDELERVLDGKGRGAVCFVGDGVNDAPVLMRADIGVAMGGIGSDAAIEASDVVLMRDELSCLPLARRIARRTMRAAYQNIVFSIAVKVAILVLSALGLTGMWIAVFGDVGVAILAILNAMRVGFKRKAKADK